MKHLRACLSIRGALLFALLHGLFFTLTAQAQDLARHAMPPPGKALVFVFRHDRTPLPAQVPAVVNTERLGMLANNTFVMATVSPGNTKVQIGDRAPNTLNFIAAPNQRYFVRVDAVFGLTVVRTEVKLVSEPEGSRTLEQSRFLGATPPALAIAPSPPRPSVTPAPPVRSATTTPPPQPQPRITPASPVSSAATTSPQPSPRTTTPAPEVIVPSMPGRAPEVAFIVSTGTLTLSNDSQVVAGQQRTYDSAAKSVLDLQVEWRGKTGLALGGEILTYTNDMAISGGAPTAKQETLALMANAKHYVQTSSRAQPFVGAGIGFTSATYGGNIKGTATGLAYQGLAGMEFRFDRLGLHVQYRYLVSTVGGTEKVKIGGNGILAGVSFVF